MNNILTMGFMAHLVLRLVEHFYWMGKWMKDEYKVVNVKCQLVFLPFFFFFVFKSLVGGNEGIKILREKQASFRIITRLRRRKKKVNAKGVKELAGVICSEILIVISLHTQSPSIAYQIHFKRNFFSPFYSLSPC